MESGFGWRVEVGLPSRDVAVIMPEFTLHAVTIRILLLYIFKVHIYLVFDRHL